MELDLNYALTLLAIVAVTALGTASWLKLTLKQADMEAKIETRPTSEKD